MAQRAEKLLVRLEPALVGTEGAASILGISVTGFKTLDRTGQIGPLPVGLGTCRRRLYSVSELRVWVEGGCPARQKWQKMKGGSDL